MTAVTNLGSYSPEDLIVIIQHPDFSHQITGFVESGTFLSFDRSVDRATLVSAVDGTHAARVLRRNKAGTITLSLMQTSESNDVLTRIGILDEEAHSNKYLFSILIKDSSGRTVMSASQAFLGNDPTVSFSDGIENRDWTITVAQLDKHIGGNSKFSPDNQTTLETLGYTVEDQWKYST